MMMMMSRTMEMMITWMMIMPMMMTIVIIMMTMTKMTTMIMIIIISIIVIIKNIITVIVYSSSSSSFKAYGICLPFKECITSGIILKHPTKPQGKHNIEIVPIFFLPTKHASFQGIMLKSIHSQSIHTILVINVNIILTLDC